MAVRWERRQTGPQNVEGGFDSRMKSGVAVKRPDQEGAENGLTENVRDVRGGKVVANFAAMLAQLNHLGVQGVHAILHFDHGFADGRGGEIGLQQRADDGGIAGGLLGHAHAQGTEELLHGLIGVTSGVDGVLQFGELHFAEGEEDVVFAGEIIEEGAFADVSGFGDVANGGFGEAFFGKELESGAEEAFTDVGATTLATAWC